MIILVIQDVIPSHYRYSDVMNKNMNLSRRRKENIAYILYYPNELIFLLFQYENYLNNFIYYVTPCNFQINMTDFV